MEGSLLGRLGRIVELLQAVYRAELSELGRDLSQTGRRGLRLGLWLLAAASLLFWAVGALLFALGAALAPRLGAAGSAAALGGALVLVAAAVALVVVRRGRALESPAKTVRRRVDAHVAWLNTEILGSVSDGEAPPRRTRWGEGRAGSPAAAGESGEEETW